MKALQLDPKCRSAESGILLLNESVAAAAPLAKPWTLRPSRPRTCLATQKNRRFKERGDRHQGALALDPRQ
jgi:hypothetical protein